MEQFISDWGYWAVFLGSLIEGESVILTAGFLASQGYLSLPKIILIAFVGTLVADQTIFFIGHFWGNKVLDKLPKFQAPAQRAFELLHKYNTLYILTFRFIYGIRIISPVIIGAAGISFRRFAFLNLISAFVWSVVSCSCGYLFGDFLMTYLTPFQRFFVLGSLGFIFLGVIFWKGWKFFHQISQEEDRVYPTDFKEDLGKQPSNDPNEHAWVGDRGQIPQDNNPRNL